MAKRPKIKPKESAMIAKNNAGVDGKMAVTDGQTLKKD